MGTSSLLSNPNYYGTDIPVEIESVVAEAIAIEDEAEKQLNPSPLRQAVSKHVPSVMEPESATYHGDLPMIQRADVNSRDIAF